MKKRKVIIMGAAGRDFHNLNTVYRDNPEFEVVAFTATQIPNIEGRKYPAVLAGKLYPNGIKIYPESDLAKLINKFGVDEVVFAYSDTPYTKVMSCASIANANGADFVLLSAEKTMIRSSKPIISVCAVRTGCGKSQVSRKVVRILKEEGLRVVAVRHPMPYGDLAAQAVQRFASYNDFEKHKCTIEEREEYEPYIEMGLVIYAGVDYEKILKMAEKEADIIVWDGGNNDVSFYKPDLKIVVLDPLRAGHELLYYPGETNERMADVLIVNKLNTATKEDVETVMENIKKLNPKAVVIKANSEITVEDPKALRGKRVLVVEDGPTITHGEMQYGAGYFAAKKFGAKEIIDPRPYAVGSIKETFNKFTHLKEVLPAMGYGETQMQELEGTINKAKCDVVVVGTPIDLHKLLKFNKPSVRVTYDVAEIGEPTIKTVLSKFLREKIKM